MSERQIGCVRGEEKSQNGRMESAEGVGSDVDKSPPGQTVSVRSMQ